LQTDGVYVDKYSITQLVFFVRSSSEGSSRNEFFFENLVDFEVYFMSFEFAYMGKLQSS